MLTSALVSLFVIAGLRRRKYSTDFHRWKDVRWATEENIRPIDFGGNPELGYA